MKYFGKKSLSSVMSVLSQIAWYVMLVFSVIVFIATALMLLYPAQFEDFFRTYCKPSDFDFNDKGWLTFKAMPVALKILFLPWLAAILVYLLRIIGKARLLFGNFKNGVIFGKNNVEIISKLGKMLIVFSILTFSIPSLIASLLLLMLCEVFKNGTALQEEHDLTV